ncbi:MAG: sensor domain-containing diguanylate cyclase, partial [Zoogloea sp.]|uniref:sensor domain-containing diguanylate cyclase n=1 Tax=Zoogloea sp. TaxID=49181 RepID=UPI003F2AA4FC
SNVNLALLKALGLEGRGDEVIGMPLENIVHPKHHHRLAALLGQEALVGNQGIFTLLRADGLPWMAQLSLFRGHNSAVSLLYFSPAGQVQDRSEDGRWAMRWVHGAKEVLFALDSQMFVTYLSPQGERVLLRKPGEGTALPFFSLFTVEDRAAITRSLRELQAGSRETALLEARLPQMPGGIQRWVEIRVWRLQLALEQESGFAGLLLDISARKQNEERLRAQRRSLHTMLDNLPGMIYRGQNDRRWTIEFASEGCFELTGYTPLELVDNHTASLADLIHPEDRDYVWGFVQMRLTRREQYELNYRIVDREGRVRWVWEQGRGLYSSKGEFLGLEGYITEVSSKGAQEEARRRLYFDNATGIVSYSIFFDRLVHLLAHARIGAYPFLVIYLALDAIDATDAMDRRRAPADAALRDRLQVEMGKRLRVVLSDCNVVARMGEASFVVLISDFTRATLRWVSPPGQDEAALVRALARLLGRPYRIEGREFRLSLKVGTVSGNEAPADAQAVLASVQEKACPVTPVAEGTPDGVSI